MWGGRRVGRFSRRLEDNIEINIRETIVSERQVDGTESRSDKMVVLMLAVFKCRYSSGGSYFHLHTPQQCEHRC